MSKPPRYPSLSDHPALRAALERAEDALFDEHLADSRKPLTEVADDPCHSHYVTTDKAVLGDAYYLPEETDPLPQARKTAHRVLRELVHGTRLDKLHLHLSTPVARYDHPHQAVEETILTLSASEHTLTHDQVAALAAIFTDILKKPVQPFLNEHDDNRRCYHLEGMSLDDLTHLSAVKIRIGQQMAHRLLGTDKTNQR